MINRVADEIRKKYFNRAEAHKKIVQERKSNERNAALHNSSDSGTNSSSRRNPFITSFPVQDPT